MEDGPTIPTPPSYAAGETLFFSCHVAGFSKTPKETIALEWKVEAVDDTGTLLAKPAADKLAIELAPEDREWKPKIRYEAELPTTALCSQCKLRISVKDTVGNLSASLEMPFAIRGLAVEPSEKLTIRNFRFLRAENDTQVLRIPAYRAGDELWARFEITGYKFAEDNRVHVDYGLTVFRPSGKQLYQEPVAATAEESSFYPKRYVTGVLNLRLEGLPAGYYPIVIEVRDHVGDHTYEERVTFKVE